MPKQQQNQPFLRDETSYRLAFGLAALISLGIALPAASRAEGSDLNISKDGANVNVNLNTGSSPDVSIRRSDDLMIIKVPKSYKGGINIDPSLKKNSVVQEVETPTGRAITIQSQQIYLHTSDTEIGPASHETKNKESKTDSKAEESNPEESSPGKPGFLQLSPTESSTGSGHNSTADSGERHTQAQSEHHGGGQSRSKRHQPSAAPQPSPLDLTRMLEQGSLLSAPVAPSAVYEPTENHNKGSHAQQAPTGKAQGKADKQKQLEQNGPAQSAENEQVVSGDMESEPLEADSKRQAAAIQASINGMLRIFFSLILVLGMIVAFVKVLLPKLLDRYPDFFEKLRESRQWSNEMPGQFMNNRPKSSPKPANKPEKKSSLHTEGPKANLITALTEQIITPFMNANSTPISVHATPPVQPPAEAPSKKSYLERLKVAGDHFQVLQSTVLGKGKELHLVELKGKQFLVATTPYTVSLLKDLSEEEDNANPSEGLFHSPEPASRPHAPEARPETKRIAPHSTASYQPPSYPNLYDDQPKAARQPRQQEESSAPARSKTIAYLSDDTSVSQHSRQMNSKPFATPPGASRQAQRRSAIPQFPAVTVNEDYPTYLNAPQRPQVQGHRPQPAMSAPQPAYIDAEEVVVLEDYDDLYGR
jgi:flagellar biogenesis protein FliO